ncbi:MAG: MFS transporter [Actinomycetota bacterium]
MIRRFKKRTRQENFIHSPPTPVPDGPSPITPGGDGQSAKVGVLKPLRFRDFRVLWTGMTVSLLGDGIYLVAIAFQVYELSNSPTALSVVFFAWTAPMVLFFLLSGVLSDRFDRRMLMIASDVLRGVSIAAMGVLSVTGNLELSHVLGLVAIYGVGDALFMPAFTAIVPDVVPKELLMEANSLDQFVRPLTMRFLGPAIGGALVGGAGPGVALLADAGTFVVSGVCVAMMRARPEQKRGGEKRSALADISEGFRFVRSRTWLWGTLASASIGLLFFLGPLEVLIPYVVKNQMNGGAGGYGLILSVGGVGAIITSVTMGQFGLPRRHITFMYSAWGIGVLLIAGFALVRTVPQAMAISFVMSGMFSAGMIVWGTLMHKLVPRDLLGRVSSLDWLVSTALVPVSFILTGPVADAIGVDRTLVFAGLIGSALTFAFLLLPGIHDTEKDGSMSGKSLASRGVPAETEAASDGSGGGR